MALPADTFPPVDIPRADIRQAVTDIPLQAADLATDSSEDCSKSGTARVDMPRTDGCKATAAIWRVVHSLPHPAVGILALAQDPTPASPPLEEILVGAGAAEEISVVAEAPAAGVEIFKIAGRALGFVVQPFQAAHAAQKGCTTIGAYLPRSFRNVPLFNSSNASCNSAWVFITIGPYQATWLLKGVAGHQQEADAVFAGLDFDLIAAVEEDQRAVVGFGRRFGIGPADAFFGRKPPAARMRCKICRPRRRRLGERMARGFATGRTFRRPGGTETSR